MNNFLRRKELKFAKFLEESRDVILLSSLNEGVYDPSIFKAIFLAGGPGSGKSFVAQKSTAGMGLKIINSDVLFEKLAKEAGVDLGKMSFEGPDVKVRDEVRDRAKELTAKQMQRYINGRLGLVIDGTGRDYTKIAGQKKMVEKLGYDTYMIFVNTSLEVAKERNLARTRSVPEELVVQAWNAVQHNIGKFQGLFGGSNFKIVDNNVYVSDREVFGDVWKEVMKFAKKPIDNWIAKEWINQAMKAKAK